MRNNKTKTPIYNKINKDNIKITLCIIRIGCNIQECIRFEPSRWCCQTNRATVVYDTKNTNGMDVGVLHVIASENSANQLHYDYRADGGDMLNSLYESVIKYLLILHLNG